ncbi:MAG: hypothetical protein HYR63_25715 [Proteobacteria bacterium]|nr:hypothetical protein [Pseudomonadota bacterium]MBI3497330.1 hypothetical protein [Pseudomonadota bacterium]
MAGRQKAQIIPPSNELRRKAVNYKKGFSVDLTSTEMLQLEKVVHAATDKFNTAASSSLKALRELVADARAGKTPATDILKRVAREALDLKGLGGTFDYPLVTRIAKSLNDYAVSLSKVGRPQLEVIALHIDALYVLLAQSITGTGGEIEWQVLEGLSQATQKFKG